MAAVHSISRFLVARPRGPGIRPSLAGATDASSGMAIGRS
jgi:hypothetical protein